MVPLIRTYVVLKRIYPLFYGVLFLISFSFFKSWKKMPFVCHVTNNCTLMTNLQLYVIICFQIPIYTYVECVVKPVLNG